MTYREMLRKHVTFQRAPKPKKVVFVRLPDVGVKYGPHLAKRWMRTVRQFITVRFKEGP